MHTVHQLNRRLCVIHTVYMKRVSWFSVERNAFQQHNTENVPDERCMCATWMHWLRVRLRIRFVCWVRFSSYLDIATSIRALLCIRRYTQKPFDFYYVQLEAIFNEKVIIQARVVDSPFWMEWNLFYCLYFMVLWWNGEKFHANYHQVLEFLWIFFYFK